MSANGKVNSIKHLTVDTATVTVNVLKFEDRQITLAVWGQIFKKSPVEVKDNKFTLTADKLQGIVNRCIPIECEKHNTLAQNHRHFLWSEGDEIWRGVVYKDKESRYNDDSDQ